MATYTLDQRKEIIIKNPNKDLVLFANKQRKELMLQINGVGLDTALDQYKYHENDKIFPERAKGAISNKDLFRRILGDEDQVFTARGGSAIYNFKSKGKEEQFSKDVANVRYGWSLHKWMQNMAIHAFRADPMGVILMETEQVKDKEGKTIPTPKCYPTYKPSGDIHDYEPNGRALNYICFKLNVEQQIQLGIKTDAGNMANTNVSLPVDKSYYRFIDDSEDVIYKLESGNIVEVADVPTIPNVWGKVPGFIVSDLMMFDKPSCFTSPVNNIMELAKLFLRDRSIRNLTKLFHGFPKAYEPAMPCPTCKGEGMSMGKACPTCTLPGMDRGMGIKPDTKVGDIAKFPIEIYQTLPSLKVADLFGFVTPPIEGLAMQMSDLKELESEMKDTYWNTTNTEVNYNGSQSTSDTATQVLVNLQPKYAKLNTTADWAEGTEQMIADLMGEYYYTDSWQGANISYGRGYMLETPNDIFDQYQTMLGKGCPDVMLDDQFEKYIKCLYQNNPITQQKCLKLFEVEPFPHRKATDVEASQLIPTADKLAKIYFGEWEDTLEEDYIIATPVEALRTELHTYVAAKVTAVNDEKQAAADAAAAQNETKIAA